MVKKSEAGPGPRRSEAVSNPDSTTEPWINSSDALPSLKTNTIINRYERSHRRNADSFHPLRPNLPPCLRKPS
jgi:hypothetical protein